MEKVESDMREILNKMDVLTNLIFGIKNELETENQSIRNKIEVVYWVIGITKAIISLVIPFKK